MAEVVKKDVFGGILENMVNSRPLEAGTRRKAVYIPHLGQIRVRTWDAARQMILEQNKLDYAKNKGRFKDRGETAGGYPMRIPNDDRKQMQEAFPVLREGTKEDIAEFWKKVYRNCPQYRIG